MTIRAKALSAGGFAALLIGLVSAVAALSNGQARLEVARLGMLDEQRAAIQDIQLQTANIWQFLTDASLTRDQDSMDEEGRAALDAAGKDLERLRSFGPAPAESQAIAAVQTSLAAFWDAGVRMMSAYGQGSAQGNAVMREFDAAGQQLLAQLQSLVTPILEQRKRAEAAFASSLSTGFVVMMALGGAGILVVIIAGLVFAFGVSTPVRRAAETLSALASRTGNLSLRLDEGTRDETGALAAAFNGFAETLRGIFTTVAALIEKSRKLGEHLSAASRVAAESVADMSVRIGTMRDGINRLDGDIVGASTFIEEIMASINSLAVQVDAQFKAIERSSASVEEIMASVGNVAKIAESRMATMESLVERIRDGGAKVAATKAVILEISRSATEMLGLIDVINKIASQTNLLAMNASIEAAHAGAAGKGFAVVAGEIRNLATTTASNAASITKSLKATNGKVAEALQTGEQSERAFETINQEVDQFSRALQEVSLSMRELSQASGEILESINTLVETSQVVKGASSEMSAGTSEILQSIHGIKEVSASTLIETNELAGLAATLNSISLKVAAFGNQNLYSTSVLAAEVRRIDTGGGIEELEAADVGFGIDWSDTLSVGVAQMDDQHKELFKRISALLEGMLGGSGASDVPALLGFIAEYVEYHFADEEKLMKSRGYPKFEAHKQLHENFKAEFQSIAARITGEGLTASLLILLQDRVITWLVEHIGRVDRQYGDFFAAG